MVSELRSNLTRGLELRTADLHTACLFQVVLIRFLIMSAFEVVGEFLTIHALASRLPPPFYAPVTNDV